MEDFERDSVGTIEGFYSGVWHNQICILVRSPEIDGRDTKVEARRPVREMLQWAREKVTVI